MVKDKWLAVYEETKDAGVADEAVFEQWPALRNFRRYGRKGDGPNDNSWLGLEIIVVNTGQMDERQKRGEA